MKIDIVSKNLDLTQAIKEYIETKINSVEKFLSKFSPADLKIRVEIARTTKHHKSGDIFYAEVNLALPGKVLVASSEAWDARVAIDAAKDKLQQEIKKYKDKAEDSQ